MNMDYENNLIVGRIQDILGDNTLSACLFGSVVLDDFHFGCSDIDIICLTEKQILPTQAERLVNLRQELQASNPESKLWRLYEGVILSKKAFLSSTADIVVYWGTSGQRITDTAILSPFCTYLVKNYGRMICGSDFTQELSEPTEEEYREAIYKHLNTIREHGTGGTEWLFDIARGLYTLRTNKVTSKTEATKWAIEQNLVPNVQQVRKALALRLNPELKYTGEYTQEWLSSLGSVIQQFADVLENELVLQRTLL